MNETVVIVGGGQAGLSCATRLRESGFAGSLTIVGDEAHLPYQRPPLSKSYLLGKISGDDLLLRSPEYLKSASMEVLTGRRVVHIDRTLRSLALDDGTKLSYTKLVLATGSRARPLPETLTRGVGGFLSLRSLTDADRLRSALTTAQKILIIGGGYIGLEVASICCANGQKVTVVESGTRLLGRVACEETARIIHDLHVKRGVEILTNTRVVSFESKDGRLAAARLSTGKRIEADIAIIGIGGKANDELASSCGLDVANGIVVDDEGRTSDPHIFAAGDCASLPYEGTMTRIESVQNAVDQGAIVAGSVLGRSAKYRPVPWFWSDQYDTRLQTAGLPIDYDDVVLRNTGPAGQMAVWYFRAGCFVAVDTINDPRTHMIARRLLAQRIRLTRNEVTDPNFDLGQRMGSIQSRA
jgi:3-phenylpropionate/trans-cinnamate dioxygenase ferredoxin reductase subunit